MTDDLSPKSQAQEANISGKLCEDSIVRAFQERGVNVFSYAGPHISDLFHQRVVRRHVPYTSIYRAQSRSELVYYHGLDGLKVRIECKSQQLPGSVDEKFPYLLENLKTVPEPAAWIVLSGHGARDGAIEWLTNEAHSYTRKIIRVYREEQARRYIKGLVENGVANAIPHSPRKRWRYA